jgi:hypothetical protein
MFLRGDVMPFALGCNPLPGGVKASNPLSGVEAQPGLPLETVLEANKQVASSKQRITMNNKKCKVSLVVI